MPSPPSSGGGFLLADPSPEDHRTPEGSVQRFSRDSLIQGFQD
jgi:hypothetical protein